MIPEGGWIDLLRAAAAEAGPVAAPWLASARADEREGVLVVSVPSPFLRDGLRRTCGGVLERLARASGLSGARVDVVVAPGLAAVSAFRVHEGNRLAYAVLSALPRHWRPDLHPIVLHGPEGCGKTHLLDLLDRAARAARVGPIVRTEAGRLGRRLGLSAKEGRTASFRAALRTARLVLVDGGETLGAKPKTQQELAHAVDALGATGGILVLASRTAPEDMPGLQPAFRSRLQGGLVIGVCHK